MSSLARIALIADVEGWAFHNYAKQISARLNHIYDFQIYFHGSYAKTEELIAEVKDFDLIHFFWRGVLSSLLSDGVKTAFVRQNQDYTDFILNTISRLNITTSVYDHLLLSAEEIKQQSNLYNALSSGYTVCSEKLNSIYRAIPSYPPPDCVVENGIDLEFFVPRNLERLADRHREIVVGWAGNSKWGGDGIDHKGIETIIKPAVEALRADGFNVRGFYADRQERWIPHSEMNDYYNAIDIYLCASDIEGTPNPALEAMASGLPVISTDVGMIPQLFGERQREYILSERRVGALKAKLAELITSAERRVELSRENLAGIKRWSWARQCEKWHDFFQLMLFTARESSLKQRSNYIRRQLLSGYLLSNSESLVNDASEIVPETNVTSQLEELKESLDSIQTKIKSMEQSKFWKMRSSWFKIKKKAGFAKNRY